MRFTIVSYLSLAATALAAPLIKQRQSSTTCGSNYYSASQVSDAVSQGYSYYQSGETVGSDSYPHTYNDYEGFSFNGVSGPYQEFPIEESGVYTGGQSLSTAGMYRILTGCIRLPGCRPCHFHGRRHLCWCHHSHWCLWKRLRRLQWY
jgi:hypothetical protein